MSGGPEPTWVGLGWNQLLLHCCWFEMDPVADPVNCSSKVRVLVVSQGSGPLGWSAGVSYWVIVIKNQWVPAFAGSSFQKVTFFVIFVC